MSTMTPEQRKGWAGTCATVRVKADNEQGFAVINAEDLDKERHELYTSGGDVPAATSGAKKRQKDTV